jgi:hypothetical protein
LVDDHHHAPPLPGYRHLNCVLPGRNLDGSPSISNADKSLGEAPCIAWME